MPTAFRPFRAAAIIVVPPPQERGEYHVVFVGGCEQTALDKCDGFLRWMFAKSFFDAGGRGHRPYGFKVVFIAGKLVTPPDSFHLLAGDFPHFLIIENVLGLFVFRRPQNRFRRVSEVAAA